MVRYHYHVINSCRINTCNLYENEISKFKLPHKRSTYETYQLKSYCKFPLKNLYLSSTLQHVLPAQSDTSIYMHTYSGLSKFCFVRESVHFFMLCIHTDQSEASAFIR